MNKNKIRKEIKRKKREKKETGKRKEEMIDPKKEIA